MYRRTIAVVGLACAAAAVPAFAGPGPADSGRAATTRISLALPDAQTLTLDLLAAQLSGGPQLFVRAERCDDAASCTARDFAAALPATALSIDPQNAVAHLAITLAGRPLTVDWKPGNGAELSSGYVDGSGAGFTASNFAGNSASASVQYDGATCSGDGGVGQALALDVDPTGSAAATPLDGLHLPDAVTLRC